MSIVEAPLTFFAVKIERVIGHAIELLQASLRKASKALNAVDMAAARSELVGPVIDAKVFGIFDIDQPIIATPTIAVDRYVGCRASTYNGLQGGFAAVGTISV